MIKDLIPIVLAQGTGHGHGDEGGVGVVPEPSSLVLALCAMAVFGLVIVRRVLFGDESEPVD